MASQDDYVDEDEYREEYREDEGSDSHDDAPDDGDGHLPEDREGQSPGEEGVSRRPLSEEEIAKRKAKTRERIKGLNEKYRTEQQLRYQEQQLRYQREDELLRLQEENERLRAEHQTVSVDALESKRAKLRQERQSLGDQIALGETDAQKKAWELDDQLADLNAEIAIARRSRPPERREGRPPEDRPERRPEQRPERQMQPTVSPAQEWSNRNPQYHQDEKFKKATDEIMREMVDEGYEFGERSFFRQLDSRLERSRKSDTPVTQGESRGFESRPGAQGGRLEEEDKAIMRAMGRDWRNPQHRKEYLDAQRRRLQD